MNTMSKMQLHNSLTRRSESFEPIKPPAVGMYACGPTVYDHIHIGNLRSFIAADLLRRTLAGAEYEVNFIMNITDIDDKTIHRSQQEYPDMDPAAALEQLTREYERVFMDDIASIGIDTASITFTRATEHIESMQELIKKILDKGIGYVRDDGIYFSISEYCRQHPYGVLTDLELDPDKLHERIRNDEYEKDEVRDFVLWKAAESGEPSWDFTWNDTHIPGRPGWHIECSAMASSYLGQPFDIHTGGIDLTFPHHENEIAQSMAANERDLANVFVHGQHLLVDNRKMAKSYNNFYTLREIEAAGYEPLAFRLLTLQAHYRSRMNFNWESMSGAQNLLRDLRAWSDLGLQSFTSDELRRDYETSLDSFQQHLENDLDTPEALAVLNGMVKRTEELGIDSATIKQAVEAIDDVLGLDLKNRRDITAKERSMIDQREAARQSKDFPAADQLRDQLEERGIGLRDTPQGVAWHRR